MLVTQSWSPGRQVFVPGTAEVLARHPVGEDPVPGDALPLQGQMLALRVLVGAGYTGVTVHAVHDMLLGMAGQPVVPRPAGACPFSGTLRMGYAIRGGGGSHADVLPEMGRGPEPDAKNTLFPSFFADRWKKRVFLSCHMKNPGWVAGKMWPVAGSVSVLGRIRAGSVSVFSFS